MGALCLHGVEKGIEEKQKMVLQIFVEPFCCRDDRIRTSDHTPPDVPSF